MNDAWIFVKEKLNNIYNKHAPLHEKRIKGRNCPWLTHDVSQLKNKRDQLKRKAEKLNKPEVWNSYKKLKNKCTQTIRKAKANYNKNLLIENSNNRQKFWKCIKNIIPTTNANTKSTSTVPFVVSPNDDDNKTLA